MTPGFYTIATALDVRHKTQDRIASNLANSETYGYKRAVSGYNGFGAALKQAGDHAPTTTQGAGVRLQAKAWDFGEGAFKSTGRELDMALRGNGFFVVRSPSGERFTRDGHFSRSEDGRLTDAQGRSVLGRSGEIQISKGAVTVSRDGTIQVDGIAVDTLRVERPSTLEGFVSEGGSYFRAQHSSSMVASTDVEVSSKVIEMSNVNMPNELVGMIENSRQAEMASRALQLIDEEIGRAISNLAS